MNKKSLEKAVQRAVTEGRRNMTWPVYREYRVEYHNDLPVLVAPEPHFRPLRDDVGTLLLDNTRQIDFGVSRHYSPLLHPEIVLRLAEIGERLARPKQMLEKKLRKKLPGGKVKELGPETHPGAEMYRFACEWGLLGVSDPSGTRESLQEFTVAAGRLSRTLRLYEAASANDGDGDEEKLRALYRDTVVHGLPGSDPKDVEAYRRKIERTPRDMLRERAFDDVTVTVAEALRARAYPAVYRLRKRDKGREDEKTVGFDGGEGFHDLLGAVYLLLSYLIRDPASRRCKQCNEFMDPNKYSDSKYCSARCKQQAWRDRERAKKQAG